jgi:hypothetical protein
MDEGVAQIIVLQNPSGNWSVMEHGFEKPLAEFSDAGTAEQYALRFAESKSAWKVDVLDNAGNLAATFNSEDDAMPKPRLA